MSKDDHQFINMMNQSATLVNGHYNVCLPVKNKSLCMLNNRAMAEQCALNLRIRFYKDVMFYRDYRAFMDGILEKGYAMKLDNA